jgi:hypothetical protein
MKRLRISRRFAIEFSERWFYRFVCRFTIFCFIAGLILSQMTHFTTVHLLETYPEDVYETNEHAQWLFDNRGYYSADLWFLARYFMHTFVMFFAVITGYKLFQRQTRSIAVNSVYTGIRIAMLLFLFWFAYDTYMARWLNFANDFNVLLSVQMYKALCP